MPPRVRPSAEDRQSFPTIQRLGGTARRLIHLGSLQFHPVGADAVRIRLQVERDPATTVTVLDPEAVVTATRQGS
jgi:hypothetical protein